MSNKKKIVVMSALVLLLAVTAVFNFVLANTNALASAEGGVTTANYFTTYRTERTTTRSEELVQLDSVIALYQAGDEKYEEATKNENGYVSAMEKELVLENMVKSLGFSDAGRFRFQRFRKRQRIYQFVRTYLRYRSVYL